MSHGDTPICQLWYAYAKEQIWPRHKSTSKAFNFLKFDLEVKCHGHIEAMNVPDTFPSDTPMWQVWYAYVKEQRNYGQDTNLHRQMDGQTDRQSDSYITPLNFVGV